MGVNTLSAPRQASRIKGDCIGWLQPLPMLILLVLVLLPGYAFAFLGWFESNSFRVVSDGNEVGSALFIEADAFVTNCNRAHHLRTEVKRTTLESVGVPFGPVQHIEVEIIDDGPLEQNFCDTVSDVHFRLPIGELLGPRVEVTAVISDRVFEDGQEQMQTRPLFEGVLQLNRPLIPVIQPAHPTVLDKTVVTINTEYACFQRFDDPLLTRLYRGGGEPGCKVPWRLEPVELGRLPVGTRIQVESRHTEESWLFVMQEDMEEHASVFEDMLDVVVSHSIPPEASGSWYNADNPGRGLTVQVIDEERLIAYWYTFDPEGQQVWIFGDGRVMPSEEGGAGVIVRFEASLVGGGVFGPGFDPAAVTLIPWGEFDLQFSACESALHSWRPILLGWEPGNEALSQLTGVNGFDCSSR
jgi:hypothetical protein